MNDAPSMGGVEGARDLSPVAQHVLERERTLRETRGERLPLDHFQHEIVKGLALHCLLADIVQRADVWMVQRRHALRFALEPRSELFVVRERGGQQLDRDFTIEPGVLRAIDLAHASLADGAEDFVGPKASGRREPGRRFLSIHETSGCEDGRVEDGSSVD